MIIHMGNGYITYIERKKASSMAKPSSWDKPKFHMVLQQKFFYELDALPVTQPAASKHCCTNLEPYTYCYQSLTIT